MQQTSRRGYMNYLEKLKQVLSLPKKKILPDNYEELWADYEKALNVSFPEDYKKLLIHYGGGGIGDFIWLFHPFYGDGGETAVNECISAHNYLREKYPEDYPYETLPAENGLIPWGRTDNGDVLYYQTNADINKWNIVIHTRGEAFFEYDMTLCEYLYKVITNKIVFVCLEEDDIIFEGTAQFYS